LRYSSPANRTPECISALVGANVWQLLFYPFQCEMRQEPRLQQTEDIHRFLQLTAKRTIDERGAINPSGWRLRNPAACWVSFSTLSLVSARCRDEADITTDFIAVTDSPRSAASVLAVSALLRAGFLPAILSGFLSTFVNRWPIGKRCASCFALEVEKAKLRYSFGNVTAQSWNDQLAPRNPYKRRR